MVVVANCFSRCSDYYYYFSLETIVVVVVVAVAVVVVVVPTVLPERRIPYLRRDREVLRFEYLRMVAAGQKIVQQ